MNVDEILMDEVLVELQQKLAAAELTGMSTRAITAQMERLKKERLRTSLGKLAQLFETWEFRDEVLFAAKLRRKPKAFEECLKEPQWATLQQLDLSMLGLPELKGKTAELFNSMPLLNTLENLHPQLLPEAPCPRITSVSMPQIDVKLLAQAFPGLSSLRFSYLSDPLRFWGHPFIEALESVTIRDLTWSEGTLTPRGGSFAHHAFVEWIQFGPPLRRLELPEEELMSSRDLYAIQDLLAAARRRGAEVIVTPLSARALQERERARAQPFSRAGWQESSRSLDW